MQIKPSRVEDVSVKGILLSAHFYSRLSCCAGEDVEWKINGEERRSPVASEMFFFTVSQTIFFWELLSGVITATSDELRSSTLKAFGEGVQQGGISTLLYSPQNTNQVQYK